LADRVTQGISVEMKLATSASTIVGEFLMFCHFKDLPYFIHMTIKPGHGLKHKI
jgi:hypothetical protein